MHIIIPACTLQGVILVSDIHKKVSQLAWKGVVFPSKGQLGAGSPSHLCMAASDHTVRLPNAGSVVSGYGLSFAALARKSATISSSMCWSSA
jgi:hypothetical protein